MTFLVAALSGVPKLEFNAFDVRLASSPISDHLLLGTGGDHGLIWDFQVTNCKHAL